MNGKPDAFNSTKFVFSYQAYWACLYLNACTQAILQFFLLAGSQGPRHIYASDKPWACSLQLVLGYVSMKPKWTACTALDKNNKESLISFWSNMWLSSMSCANNIQDIIVDYMKTCLSASYIPFPSIELPQTQQRRLHMTRTSARYDWGSHFVQINCVGHNFSVSVIPWEPTK